MRRDNRLQSYSPREEGREKTKKPSGFQEATLWMTRTSRKKVRETKHKEGHVQEEEQKEERYCGL